MIVAGMFLMVFGFMLNVKNLQAKECASFNHINHNITIGTSESIDENTMDENYNGYICVGFSEDWRYQAIGYDVIASEGAVVECKVDNQKPYVAEVQWTENHGSESVDHYNLVVKIGSKATITAKFEDAETVLTIKTERKTEVKRAPKIQYQKAEGYDYGKFTLASEEYVLDFGMDNLCFTGRKLIIQELSIQDGKLVSSDQYYEVDSDVYKQMLNLRMKDVADYGGNVYVLPAIMRTMMCGYGYDGQYAEGLVRRWGELGNKCWMKGTGIHLLKDGNGNEYVTYDKDVTISVLEIRIRASKVRIPKIKNAPVVKVNAVKGMIYTRSNQEFKIKSDAAEDEMFSEWANAGNKMKLADLKCNHGIASGATIRVRVKATNKNIASRFTDIQIPAQAVLSPDDIIAAGL